MDFFDRGKSDSYIILHETLQYQQVGVGLQANEMRFLITQLQGTQKMRTKTSTARIPRSHSGKSLSKLQSSISSTTSMRSASRSHKAMSLVPIVELQNSLEDQPSLIEEPQLDSPIDTLGFEWKKVIFLSSFAAGQETPGTPGRPSAPLRSDTTNLKLFYPTDSKPSLVTIDRANEHFEQLIATSKTPQSVHQGAFDIVH